MSEPRESGQRAISVGGHINDLVHGLRHLQARLSATLAEVDSLLADAEFLLASPMVAAPASPEVEERTHLKRHGDLGTIVLRVAEQHSILLRLLLGPGAPTTNKARLARLAAVTALSEGGWSNAAIARVLRVSAETVRQNRALLNGAHKAVA